MRVAHLSDLHFGAEAPEQVAALHACVQALEPTLVVASGDVTQRGAHSEFAAARAFLDGLERPWVATPGNHDTPLLNLPARIARPFARYASYLGEPGAGAFDGARLAVRAINTARGVQSRLDWSLGAVDLGRLDRALASLRQAPAEAVTVLMCHHPFVTPANAPWALHTRRGRAAADRTAAAGVDLVLSGHTHVPFVEPLPFGDGKSYSIGAGTAFSRRVRGTPASFNCLAIEDGVVEVRSFAWTGAAYTPQKPIRLPRR